MSVEGGQLQPRWGDIPSQLRVLLLRIRHLRPLTIAFLLLVMGWIVGLSAYVVYRYSTFQTNAFDLGIFNQAFATALRGQWFYETPDLEHIPSGSFLGVHFNLLMFALLPVYALAPAPPTLLVLQTITLGLGAVPIWLIANRVLKDPRVSLLFAALFLFNPAVLSLGIYDFHLEAFLPLFLGAFFYAYLARRWRWYAASLAFALATLEFAAILAFMITVAHFLQALRRRTPGEAPHRFPLRLDLTRTQALVLVSTLVVTPLSFYASLALSGLFSGVSAAPGDLLSGFTGGAGTSLLGSAYWWQFWLLLLGSVLFLPLLEPRNLVIILPWFVISSLSVPITFVVVGYQYGGAFVAPYLVWGAIFGIARLRKQRTVRRLVPFLLGTALVISLALCPLSPLPQGRLPGIAYHGALPVPDAHTAILTESVAMIPGDASVLTQNNLFPQVSNRREAYVFLPNGVSNVSYVLADMSSPYYGQPIWGNQTMSGWLPYFMSTGAYGVRVLDDGVVLLERGYAGPILLQGQTSYTYDYRDFTLFYGDAVADPTSTAGTVLSRLPGTMNGTFFYGPYVRIPPGNYSVTFRLKAENGSVGGMLLDAFLPLNLSGGEELGHRYVNASDFPAFDAWTSFTFNFSLPTPAYFRSAVELRGMYASGGPFFLDTATVVYAGPPSNGTL